MASLLSSLALAYTSLRARYDAVFAAGGNLWADFKEYAPVLLLASAAMSALGVYLIVRSLCQHGRKYGLGFTKVVID